MDQYDLDFFILLRLVDKFGNQKLASTRSGVLFSGVVKFDFQKTLKSGAPSNAILNFKASRQGFG